MILVWREYRGPQHAIAVREPDDAPGGEKRCYVRLACGGLGGYVFDSHVLEGVEEDVECADCRAALELEDARPDEPAGWLTEAGWAAVAR